jgi:hypothetical protein
LPKAQKCVIVLSGCTVKYQVFMFKLPKFAFSFLLVFVLLLFGHSSSKANTASDLKNVDSSNMSLNKFPQKTQTIKQSIMYVARLPKDVALNEIPGSIFRGDVGHAFIAILTYQDGKVIHYTTIGKWLATGASRNMKSDRADLQSILDDTQSKLISYEEKELKEWELPLIHEVIEKEDDYDLVNSNCTDFLIRVMNIQLRTLRYKTGETGNPILIHRHFKNTRIKF